MTAATVPVPGPGPTAAGVDPIRPSTRRGYSTAWWGMAVLIMTEGMVFAILLASYFFLRASAKEWPLGGIEVPKLELALPFSFVLWGSSIPIFWAEAAIRKGRVGAFKAGMAISFVMGLSFLLFTLYDFDELTFGWRDNAYGSIYYTIVGLHAFHVFIGLAMSVGVQAKAWLGRLDHGRHSSAEVFSLYWHFVDVVWLFVFPSLFLSLHL
ncbi:MAG: cytochrome c oxidase subunit [Actinomycetota bacterium]|nr:cytochrome c oxidase subunit [Actinomycetota bacterium]